MSGKVLDELIFVGKVLDNVHGFIWYTEAEEKIINSLLFKRLQGIKQLSLVNWVFPGSEHTRFIHSLGVMHIADRMALALSLSTRERKIARLAGLLHDIGHYPLSHVCEFPYKKKMEHYSETEFCNDWNADVLNRIQSFQFKAETEFMKTSKNGHHEEIGALIIQNSKFLRDIIEKECGSLDAVDTICDMITGNIRDEHNNELLVQLLHSELDADGIDYLLRDAKFSGTSFGSFELDQLISNLCCYKKDNKKILCVRPKGIAAADQYLLNKFFSYSQVVFNKHTSILEWMAEQIVSWMQEKSAYFPSRDTLRLKWTKEKDYYNLLRFTDDYFWHSLRGIVENPARNAFPDYIISLCTALLNHQECEYVEGSEIKLIVGKDKGNEFLDAVRRENLLVADNEIIVFSERSMTKHVKIDDFNKNLKPPDDSNDYPYSDSDLDVETYKSNLRWNRLLEGICVLDGDDAHLLCDDPRSLMQHLCEIRLLIIRKYKMAKN